MTAFDLTPPTEAQRHGITAGLDAHERRVLLQHGTEAAFCGVFLDNKKEGTYFRARVGPVFSSPTMKRTSNAFAIRAME